MCEYKNPTASEEKIFVHPQRYNDDVSKIRTFLAKSQPSKAVQYIQIAAEAGIPLQRMVYKFLLNGLLKDQQSSQEELANLISNVFATMNKTGDSPDIHLFNDVLSGLSKLGYKELAEDWFKRLCSYDLKPVTLTFNAMMHMYARLGKIDKVEEVVTALNKTGLPYNSVTYAALMLAYENHVAKVEEIFNEACEKVSPTPYMYGILFKVIRNDSERTKNYFERLKSELFVPIEGILAREVFRSVQNVNDPAFTKQAYVDLKPRFVNMDRSTCEVLVSILSKSPITQDLMFELLDERIQAKDASESMFRIAIGSLATKNDPDKVWKYFKLMQKFGFGLTSHTINALLASQKEEARLEQIKGLAADKGIAKDQYSYNILIKNAQTFSEALQHYEEMKQTGHKPEQRTFVPLLTKLQKDPNRAGAIDNAIGCWTDMKKFGIDPSDTKLNSLLFKTFALLDVRKGLMVYGDMLASKYFIESETADWFLQFCRKLGKIEEAKVFEAKYSKK